MGGAAGTRACWWLKPPPVLSVRPRGLKLSSRAYWLSDSGELSYEFEYAAGGPDGGGRPDEFMPES